MTRRLVGWLVLVPLCVILVVFALANRQMVSVNFDPLESRVPLIAPVGVPLYAVIYAVLIVGVVLGGTAVWFTQGRNRREKRQLRRQTEQLRREMDHIRRPGTGHGLPAADDLLELD